MIFPCRWRPGTVWTNLTGLRHDVYYGIRNLIRWFPVIWRDRDWDWLHIAELLETKLRHTEELERVYGHHTTSERDAKDMKTCFLLLNRIRTKDYDYEAILWHGDTFKAYDNAGKRRKSELAYCCQILSKHMLGWWD